jgi:hypothetical protein
MTKTQNNRRAVHALCLSSERERALAGRPHVYGAARDQAHHAPSARQPLAEPIEGEVLIALPDDVSAGMCTNSSDEISFQRAESDCIDDEFGI